MIFFHNNDFVSEWMLYSELGASKTTNIQISHEWQMRITYGNNGYSYDRMIYDPRIWWARFDKTILQFQYYYIISYELILPILLLRTGINPRICLSTRSQSLCFLSQKSETIMSLSFAYACRRLWIPLSFINMLFWASKATSFTVSGPWNAVNWKRSL